MTQMLSKISKENCSLYNMQITICVFGSFLFGQDKIMSNKECALANSLLFISFLSELIWHKVFC